MITVGKDHFDPSLSTPIRKNGSLNREVFWKNSHGESKESNHVAGVKHLTTQKVQHNSHEEECQMRP